MKKLIIIILSCLCYTNYAANKYQVSLDDFDIVTVNGKEEIVLKSTRTTSTYTRQNRDRHITKVPIYELNADSIQFAINGPLAHKSKVQFIIPQYVTASSVLFNGNKHLHLKVDGAQIQRLYTAIYHNKNIEAKNIALNIFNSANRHVARCILYGKASNGKNVGYLYNIGKENLGIVFFYPDNFPSLLKNIWKNPTNLGWDEFLKTYFSIMLQYNPHLNIKITDYDHNQWMLITY